MNQGSSSVKRPLSKSGEKVSPYDKKTKGSSSVSIPACDLDSEITSQENMDKLVKAIEKIQQDVSRIPHMASNIETMSKKLDDFQTSLEFSQAELGSAREDIIKLKTRCDDYDKLKDDLSKLNLQNRKLEKKLNDLENYSRCENFIIHILKPSKDVRSKTVSTLFIVSLIDYVYHKDSIEEVNQQITPHLEPTPR